MLIVACSSSAGGIGNSIAGDFGFDFCAIVDEINTMQIATQKNSHVVNYTTTWPCSQLHNYMATFVAMYAARKKDKDTPLHPYADMAVGTAALLP